MQVDPLKPKLKPPGTKHLKRMCDKLLSTSGFRCISRHYIQQFSTIAQSARTVASWTLADDDRGIGDALFELPGMLAVCGTASRTLLATS